MSEELEEKTLEFDFGVYQGEVSTSTGLRHGWGILAYHSGNSYEGAWADGAPHGDGTKRYRNGDCYSGSWVQGKRSGSGQYTHIQGDVYVGEYANDVCHGKGRIVTRNGDCYQGEWARGKKHGSGVETLVEGKTFTGTWINGKKHGHGSLTTLTERIVGVWVNEKLTEVLSRQEMEYQPQVRPMVTSALSAVSSDATEEVEAIPIAPHVVEELQRAGADPAMVHALTDFSQAMSGRMGNLFNGIGSIEAQLSSLTDALESLAGLDNLDDGMLDEIEGIPSQDTLGADGNDGAAYDGQVEEEEEEDYDGDGGG